MARRCSKPLDSSPWETDPQLVGVVIYYATVALLDGKDFQGNKMYIVFL